MKALQFLCAAALVAASTALGAEAPDEAGIRFWRPAPATIRQHLGRPYVWGACGLKSYDCSGFVWRVMLDNGVLLKRTTARKFSMMLAPVSQGNRYRYGNIVFFDSFKHCGIVNGPGTFYHSQSSKGTNLSEFNPYWRGLICGFRGVAAPVSPPSTEK